MVKNNRKNNTENKIKTLEFYTKICYYNSVNREQQNDNEKETEK